MACNGNIFTYPLFPGWSWGPLNLLLNEYRGFHRGLSRPSVGLATLPPPNVMAVCMWILTSNIPVGLHSL